MKKTTTTIPVVMVNVADPVGSGLVASLSRPGGNITGVSAQQTEVYSKGLQLLKEMAPNLSHVAWLWNPTNRAAVGAWKGVQAAAPTMGLTVQSVEVRDPDDFDMAFA